MLGGYENVKIEVTGGDPLAIERAFRDRNEIQKKYMAQAMAASLKDLQDEWKRLAPVGKGREANPLYPTWKPRAAGAYRRSIKIDPPKPFEIDNLIGGVYSDDLPTARILEDGSGIYRTGPGSRRYIRPTGERKYMAIPVASNEASAGFVADGARFIKSVKGQRPQHPARKARIATAPHTRARFKRNAALAAAEIKRMIHE
jgi:hypothetical protein